MVLLSQGLVIFGEKGEKKIKILCCMCCPRRIIFFGGFYSWALSLGWHICVCLWMVNAEVGRDMTLCNYALSRVGWKVWVVNLNRLPKQTVIFLFRRLRNSFGLSVAGGICFDQSCCKAGHASRIISRGSQWSLFAALSALSWEAVCDICSLDSGLFP